MSIFYEEAPKYWSRGIPVIPLKPKDKMPWSRGGWQKFSTVMPTRQEQDLWLQDYGEGNIGLPLGPASGLVAIDVDSTDPRVLGMLDRVLPRSPWKRIGAKGWISVYRYNPKIRNTNLKDKDGNMILEIMGKGRQFVLPPSIHPVTDRPYTANCDLLDVISIVPELPSDIELILRGALTEIGVEVGASGSHAVTDFVPAGARDSEMVRTAGLFACDIRRGKITLLEALGMMTQWVKDYTAKVAGDDLDPGKARAKVIEFLIRDIASGRHSIPTGWDAGLSSEDKVLLGVDFASDTERWSVDKILTYLESEFSRYTDPNSNGFRSAVDWSLGKIARNPTEIKALDEAKILNFIQGAGGKNFSVATLKRDLGNLKKGDLIGDNHTDIAAAVLEDLVQNGEVRFAGAKFWQWKGAEWAHMDEIREIVVKIQDDYGTLPAAKRQHDHMAIMKTISNQTNKPLAIIERPMINFANGVLDDDLVLHPHSPDYGHTYVLKYRYLPEEAGKCPQFFAFLDDCWGEDDDFQEKVLALQEMMAVTLFGVGPVYQRVFCLKGKQHTGKTRIIEMMQGLMPENCTSSVAPGDWGDKFSPAQMHGKLMNHCGEISEKQYIDGAKFKMIVEGTMISAQQKFGQLFEFRPTCAQWFAGNFLPKTKDTSGGFNRRWLFLEFNKEVLDEDKIIGIDKKILAAEREQICAWAVQGIERMRRNGQYTMPVSHEILVNTMATDNNSVHYFLADCPRLRIGREAHIGRSETRTTETLLHNAYLLFCISTGVASRVTPRRFHTMMKDLERTFRFKQHVAQTDRNGMIVEYEWITLADATEKR